MSGHFVNFQRFIQLYHTPVGAAVAFASERGLGQHAYSRDDPRLFICNSFRYGQGRTWTALPGAHAQN